MTSVEHVASTLIDDDEGIQLLFAFNSVGKTRLFVACRNASRLKAVAE